MKIQKPMKMSTVYALFVACVVTGAAVIAAALFR